MSAIIDSRDPRAASIGPCQESRDYVQIKSDIVSAVARNRFNARIEASNGSSDLVSVFCEALAHEACGASFIAALSAALSGRPDAIVDWVEEAAGVYADDTASLIAARGDE